MIVDNNKYYTPEIEEFHIGFEFEYENKLLKQWRQEKLSLATPWDWETIGLIIKRGAIRVKYLDREDIESLGFIYIKSQPGLTEDYFELVSTEWCMDYDYSTQYCRIFINSDGDSTFFAGTIKNKSELKRILKMLNILK